MMTSPKQSLQEQLAPLSICFGCGPANDKGLKIRSFAEGDYLIAEWMPEPQHQAFPGVLNGGIIGTLLDCHLNWTAAYHLYIKTGSTQLPCTVTAEYEVKLRRPTPTSEPLQLRAHVVESTENRVVVEGSIQSGEKITATCRGVFVAVKSDHPAFHRW